MDLDVYVYGPDEEIYDYPMLRFDMTLNDLKGGSATGTVYVDTGSGFEKAPVSGYYKPEIEYDPDTDTGDTWSAYIPCPIEPEDGKIGISGKAKIIFDITYPDGTTDTIETETRPVHNKSFAYINKDYGSEYGNAGWIEDEGSDPVTGDAYYTMSLDVIIDETLAPKPELAEPNSSELWLEAPDTYYHDPDIRRFRDADDAYHIIYTFYSDSIFPDGEYWFSDKTGYPEDDHNVWSLYDLSYYFIKGTLPEHPSFTAISQTHEGPLDGSDKFIYDFTIELNDVDTAEPVTAVLQEGDPEGGSWKNVSGYTLTYSGSGSTWTGQFVYDIEAVDIGSASGILRQMRIVCDYTLTNGVSGSIYSEDIGKIYSYKGNYVEAQSCEIDSGKLSASFLVDKDLVDTSPDKLKPFSLYLIRGGSSHDITTAAEISAADENSLITAAYELDSTENSWTGTFNLILTMEYMDKDGKIVWRSSDSIESILPEHRPPQFTLAFPFNGRSGVERPPLVAFDTELNDLKGGTATATVYFKYPDGSYVPYVEYEEGIHTRYYEEYSGDDEWNGRIYYNFESPWTVNWHGSDITYDHARLVIDYEYPDGTVGQWESPDFTLAFGYFTDDGECVYDKDALTLTAVFPVWEELDPAAIWLSESILTNNSAGFESGAEVTGLEGWTDEDGKCWLRVTAKLDAELQPGTYHYWITPEYATEEGNWWNCMAGAVFTVED